MAQEILEPHKTLESVEDRISFSGHQKTPPEYSSSSADPSLSRNVSFSRLNAGAPSFVPRSNSGSGRAKIHHGSPNQPNHHHHHQPVIHVFNPPSPVYDYYGSSGSGFVEPEVDADPDPVPPPAKDGLTEDVIHKIKKQVEYYFSDANLATTEHLMRFITKDPEGFVPISVIGSFKKVKALVHNNTLLPTALRTSAKLVVSEDGKKVKRLLPFTEADVDELQSRIVVAENLPEDHCYQSLMKVFSVTGSVRTIRTCYPQTPNGPASATNRSSKIDMLFSNKLHAFVEYETVEDAEKAVAELNDERNWRSGLRVRLLYNCMVQTKHATGRGKKPEHEGDGNAEEEEDVSTNTDQTKFKQVEEPSQATETSLENMGEDNDKESGVAKRGRGRGRGGGKGRARGQYHHNNSNSNSNSNRLISSEHPVSKQPPGPRMPDGTRGFTIGRGRPVPPSTAAG